MDVFAAVIALQPNANFYCDDTYESLVWQSDDIVKPTKAEVEAKNAELAAAQPLTHLRVERGLRLMETDKYALPDWPHADDAARQAWLVYRQALRDLPANTPNPQLDADNQLTNVTWPTSPPFVSPSS